MTINDIEKAALSIMFANYENDLTEMNMDDVRDEEYLKYTVNMKPCINRALTRIQHAGVLPLQREEITYQTACDKSGYNSRYKLDEISPDIFEIVHIAKEGVYAYEPAVEYFIEAGTLVIKSLATGEKYILVYVPKVKKISLTAASGTEVEVPDEIAELIPYFIKAELFEEDEPSLATQARNIFEASLSALTHGNYSFQGGVRNVF